MVLTQNPLRKYIHWAFLRCRTILTCIYIFKYENMHILVFWARSMSRTGRLTTFIWKFIYAYKHEFGLVWCLELNNSLCHMKACMSTHKCVLIHTSTLGSSFNVTYNKHAEPFFHMCLHIFNIHSYYITCFAHPFHGMKASTKFCLFRTMFGYFKTLCILIIDFVSMIRIVHIIIHTVKNFCKKWIKTKVV